uniref:Uncharacterized protein n=1 Tax=Podoviridae sp. ctz6O13 TaxID=2827757 RepID=A0A8S5TL12_9CAUD|nr:MAG TPA: hypothetical protein [Podoviridae sp. ctz6O13]
MVQDWPCQAFPEFKVFIHFYFHRRRAVGCLMKRHQHWFNIS